jgi:AraC-like DNA-binding protein
MYVCLKKISVCVNFMCVFLNFKKLRKTQLVFLKKCSLFVNFKKIPLPLSLQKADLSNTVYAMNDILYTFHITGIFSLLLSGIFIASVRGAKRPIIYMSLNRFVATLFAGLFMLQLYRTPMYGQALWNPLTLLTILAVNPLLFAYIFGMLRPGSPGVRFWLWTYLPTVALATLYFTFEAIYGRLPLFSGYAGVRNCLNMPQLWVLFAAAGFSVVLISVYTARAAILLRQHKRNLESDFSCTEGSTLGWMWWVVAITLFKWLILMMRITTEGYASAVIAVFLFTVEPILIAVLVVRQKDLYCLPSKDIEKEGDPVELSSGKRNKLQHDLLSLLENEEIFKDPELTNEKVCEMLGTNRTYLWQVINLDMDTNFYNLINKYRLNKSVTLLQNVQYRDKPLKIIAGLSGFKTLRAFSACFKQKYNKTPTEWRAEALPGVNDTE